LVKTPIFYKLLKITFKPLEFPYARLTLAFTSTFRPLPPVFNHAAHADNKKYNKEKQMKLKKAFNTIGCKHLIGTALPLLIAAQAQGIEFYGAGVEATLDSQISLGSSFRMEDQDQRLLDKNNNNLGDLNYKNGDAFSQIFKGSHDLQVNYENFGAFIRGKYWYDAALENDDNLNDDGNHKLAKFSGATILDAFVYGTFEMADMPLDVRLGKQVVSWGESTFIGGGLNAINPYDASAFRRAGAELKEGLIPTNMAFASVALTDILSAEAFYQLEFHESVTVGCGTYFSTNDYQSEGCDSDVFTSAQTHDIKRNDNAIRRPDADGQFGMAFRYFSDSLDTEFGFYAMNIHSRAPIVSGTKSVGVNDLAIFSNTKAFLMSAAGGSRDNATATQMAQGAVVNANADSQTFFVEYPEDIQIAGLSFATNIASVAVAGEFSHKKNTPFQINSTQLSGSGLTGELKVATGSTDPYLLALNEVEDGANVDGYRSFDVSQAQVSAIKLFDQVLGASRVTLIGEAAYRFTHGFDDNDGIFFSGAAPKTDATTGITTSENSATESSWGYRARVMAQYNDVFSGVNLTPALSFRHDVNGVSGAPSGNFKEGTKVTGLSVKASYRNTYNAALSYTQFKGEENDYKTDRDFAAISVGMQF